MTAHSTVVVFDLDDTLIDTKGVLLPDALRRVAEATGLDVEQLNARGKRIDEVLTGLDLTPEQRVRAAETWYGPDVPPLEPLPGARAVLDRLAGRVHLVLLTRGSPERQQRKIDQCGLRACFDEILIRAIEQPGSKRDDLAGVLARTGVTASRCVVVGDDERDELRHAADLGCLAIKVPDVPLRDVLEKIERILS